MQEEERDIIKKLQGRDQQALSTLYDQYSGALYGIVLRIVKDEPLSQEVLQEVFMKIWEKSLTFDPKKGKFFTWCYRIAKNLALNAIRSKRNIIQSEDLGVYEDRSEGGEELDLGQLNGSLGKLEHHHQKALELVYFNGLTHQEAHEEMGVPLGTFKSYIRQALKKLREHYQGELMFLIVVAELLS